MRDLETKQIQFVQISEKLIESEMRYRRLFETAQYGILILDYESGNYFHSNNREIFIQLNRLIHLNKD